MPHSNIRVLASLPVFLILLPVCNADIVAQHIYTDDVNSTFNSGAGMSADGGDIFDNRIAQSFTATTAGQIGAVRFVASAFGSTTADLRVSLVTMTQGQPASTLASLLVASETFTSGFLSSPYEMTHSIDFTSMGISVEQGQRYALVFSTDATEANYRIYGDFEGYSDGAYLFSQNGNAYSQQSGDIYFQVETTVPSPSSTMLLGLGTLVTTRRRR